MRKKKKNIFIYLADSFTKTAITTRKHSLLITGKRPFTKDENELNYELDSEDELEEM